MSNKFSIVIADETKQKKQKKGQWKWKLKQMLIEHLTNVRTGSSLGQDAAGVKIT